LEAVSEAVFAPEVVLEPKPEVDEHKYADEQEEEEENMVEASGEVLPCTRPIFPDISSMAT
ncbi:hypothetical protein A2U01_0066369, partial [Trifolium medium]|nr:hypothetical protein [Trifolium medium]